MTPIRVLVIEDRPEDFALLLNELRAAGFSPDARRVSTAADFVAALAQPWELILADYELPGFGALAALDELAHRALELPLIVVSGLITDEMGVSCLRRGAVDYLLKDRLARLGDAVRAALAAHRLHAEKRLVERSLQDSMAHWQALLAGSSDAIYAKNREGRYVLCNDAAARLLGKAPLDVLGRNDRDLLGPEAVAAILATDREILSAGGSSTFEERVSVGGMPRIFLTTKGAMRDAGGNVNGLFGIAQDITERKHLEEQLRQSQKVEALGRLAGGVAHDFNNLLSAIIGFSDLAQLQPGVPPRVREYLQEIQRAGEQASALTGQLLAFGRKQVVQLRPLDLNALVGDMQKMLGRLIGENMEIQTVLSPELERVTADAAQLQQVLLNLVVNARDAMPAGGKLTVETMNVLLDETAARQRSGLEPGPYVMLAVSDTGEGMSADTLSHLFEPFFTTKKLGKGTGLGLATVYGIVKQSGGHICVDSERGRGSTFKVYLPRRAAPTAAPPAAAEPIPGGARGLETVLLAEDDPTARAVATEILRSNDYRVLDAAGAEEALDLARECRGRIDLLLTDVVMPKMTGLQLAEAVRTLHPETLVLYMSGYAENVIVHGGVLDPGIAFLQKPFSHKSLPLKVREVLGRPKPAAAPQ